MDFDSYVQKFYKAIETHNQFFPGEKLLGLETYKNISKQEVSEREIDNVSDLANKYIYEIIDVCKRVNPLGFVCRCHFLAEILRVFYLSRGLSPQDFSYTVGDVFFENQSIYKSSVDIVRGLIAEGPDSKSELKCHCWLTYKNKIIIDPALQFHLNERGLIPLEKQSLVYVLGNGYDSISYAFTNGQERKIGDFLRYEPYLVDNDFYFRVEDFTPEYQLLAQKLKIDSNTYEKIMASQKRVSEKHSSVQERFFETLKNGEPGRNDPCWCGSGIKYKKCHGKLL